MWEIDQISSFDIRLVFTLPPRDSTLEYKRYVHLWNNFPCILTLYVLMLYFSEPSSKSEIYNSQREDAHDIFL